MPFVALKSQSHHEAMPPTARHPMQSKYLQNHHPHTPNNKPRQLLVVAISLIATTVASVALFQASVILCAVCLGFSGFVHWTFLEYTIHRFVFHKNGEETHNHCQHDNDSLICKNRLGRILMVLLLLILLELSFHLHFFFFYTAGLLSGWLWLSYTKVLMQWNGCIKLMPGLYRQHLYHAAGGFDRGFGWSTTLWDRIFHTAVPPGYIFPHSKLTL